MIDQIIDSGGGANPPAEPTQPSGVRRLLHGLPVLCGGFSAAIGLFVLSGWLFGRPSWTTIFPELPTTTANSAIMAAFAGVALILLAPATASRRRSVVGKLCAGVVAAIAGLTIAEYALGRGLGIDQLVAASVEMKFGHNPGRPSPQTATAYVLIASSLLTIDWRMARGKRPAEILALLAGLIPLLALLGYLFEAAALYKLFTVYPYIGMGIASATALLVLSAGTLAARADSGILSVLMASDSGGLAARQLVAWLFVYAAGTCAVAIGARAGLYDEPIASAFSVLLGTVGGSAFVLRVSLRLSHLDAERNEAQERLRQSQERFDLALRGAELAAWDWNVKSGEVIFSPRWAEMRGYRPDEIQPHVDAWISGIHPDDRPAIDKALNDHFQGRIAEYETEHRVRTKSGGWIWILDRGKVFERDERGQPTRMVGTELDITARKRLEEELRLAEAKSSGILSISADAIVSIDDAQRITSFNEGAAKIFGYAKDELIGAPVEVLIPERHRPTHRQHVERFAAAPEVSRRMGERGMEIVGLRKNGEEFPADAAISKLEVGGRRIFTVALHDITEQQRREREAALLAEVGAVLTSSLDFEQTLPVFAKQAVQDFSDFCLVDLVNNGQVRRLSVVSRDPSHAWICNALMKVPADRTRDDPIRLVLDTKRPTVIANVNPHSLVPWAQDATSYRLFDAIGLASIIAVPLVAHGEVLGAIAFVRSAASRKYGPPDAGFAEELAQRAMLSIENGQLYRTAQRAIQARDDMMGVVAHDLRNPLGAILMQTSLVRETGAGANECAEECISLIERSAKRMNRLIQDLLDVTRIEAQRFSIDHADIDTRSLLSESVDAQRSLAASQKLELRLDATQMLPHISGDRDRLLQVFENLIGNAIKFTEPGGRITVGARPQDGDIVFRVSDTGTGIEPEDLPHLFDRFWQADGKGGKGAGLGLAIVKGIVEAHGGRISVESTPSRGSTFSFTLPTAPSAEVSQAAAA